MPDTYESTSSAAFLGDMYARWTLDCLVEIAHAISIDYFSHPDIYQGDDTPNDIVHLWLSYGTAKNFPNKEQRRVLAGAIFGDSDGYPPKGTTAYTDTFHRDVDTLFQTCIAAQTATSAQSREGLNITVQTAVLPEFQSYLGGFPGKAACIAHEQLQAVSEIAFEILRSNTVSSRFIGIHPPISDQWPLQQKDPNGDKLIAECVSTLNIDSGAMPKDFPHLRTLAQVGREAIEAIVDPDAALDDIIRKVYAWAMFTGRYPPYTGK